MNKKIKLYFVMFLCCFFILRHTDILAQNIQVDNEKHINNALLQAVKEQNVENVKVCINQQATNLYVALQCAHEYRSQEIVSLLEKAINSNEAKVVVLGGVAVGTGILLSYVASYLHETFFAKTKVFDGFKTFSEWEKVIQKLPKNREGATFYKHSAFSICGNKEKQWKEFYKVLDEWLHMKSIGIMSQKEQWIISNNGINNPPSEFFNIGNKKIPFTPFAQKLLVEPEETLYIRGDLHGDIISLMTQLKYLKQEGILDDNFKLKKGYKILTLGDYVDRGQYGVEVIYTLMRLSLANPDQVFLVRGNHEETDFNAWFTFQKEIDAKFGDKNHERHRAVGRMYDFMPAVIYMGCKDQQSGITNYVQCCHGGLEEGYDPQRLLDSQYGAFQLLGVLNRKLNCCKIIEKEGLLKKIKDDIKRHSHLLLDNIVLQKPDRTKRGYDKKTSMAKGEPGLGFMWNDFNVQNTEQLKWTPHRGLEHGKELTEEILAMQSSNKSKIQGVLRGHQHFEDRNRSMMKGLLASLGVYKLWKKDDFGNYIYETDAVRKFTDGMVWTFNVAPDSVYGKKVGFDFDAMAEITVQEKYENWNMKVVNTYPFQKHK